MLQQDYTYTVDQKFFVEALKGARHPSLHLDRFPEEVYNTSPDSVLYKFIYVLIGPTGVGALRKKYLEARLIYEEAGLNYFQLEKFYANPLAFGKVATETYSDDPATMLDKQIWSTIKAKNQAYKNRVVDFFHAARLGTTPEGMRLAAKSGIGQDVFIIENYQYLFNENSDVILDIENFGVPSRAGYYNTESFTILPNAEKSRTVVQKIIFEPTPTITSYNNIANQGSFIITFGGISTLIPFYRKFVEDVVENSSILNETVDGNGFIRSAAGEPLITTSFNIQSLLNENPLLKNNVKVFGNFEDGFEIHMANQLGNQQVDTFVVTSQNLKNFLGYENSKTCVPIVSSSSGVISANSDYIDIDTASRRTLETALNKLKPITAYPVYQAGSSQWQQNSISKTRVFETSHYAPVSRFVTGNPGIQWPNNSVIDWIQPSIEVEAPVTDNFLKESYQNFHVLKPEHVYAYNETALDDEEYQNDITNVTKDGYLSTAQLLPPEFFTKFPSLEQYKNSTFESKFIFNDSFKPRTATALEATTELPLIDESYLTTFFDLAGAPKLKLNKQEFWASASKSSGSDYIEIDLNQVEAVNFIAFEVLGCPLEIKICYDDFDYENVRNFIEVSPTFIPNTTIPMSFDKDVAFIGSHSGQSPWEYKNYLFGDNEQKTIFTRYIRIEFIRTMSDFLISKEGLNLGWPVCVRNLRVGRIV